jgi:hypothetical protein
LIQFTGADTRTKQYIGHAQAKCGTVHYEPCKDSKTPKDIGYIDNMVAAPYWARVKQALSVQGDWSVSDDIALQKLIKQGAASAVITNNSKKGSQSSGNSSSGQQSSSASTLWILFMVCLLAATAVLVYMYIQAAQGRNSDLPLTLCCVLPSHKAV